MVTNYSKRILWWGRGHRDYSRNVIVLSLLSDLGFKIEFFHPQISKFGKIEALLRRILKPDYIWVPCFRHDDVLSASYFAEKWEIPLIFDPLISAYQKQVFERKKWVENSKQAKAILKWEATIFSKPDIIICDTKAHGNYFYKTFSMDPDKLRTLYVGAEENSFKIDEKTTLEEPFKILFYGSFLELQGTQVIAKAAKMAEFLPIKWVFIGEGPCLEAAENISKGLKKVKFEPWMSYEKLTKRISDADILLGVFGDTLKSDMVIPNKVFQAMAAGKPLITQKASAYIGNIANNNTIGWAQGGSSESLFSLVCEWLEKPERLINRGKQTRLLYDKYFSKSVLKLMLEDVFSASRSNK